MAFLILDGEIEAVFLEALQKIILVSAVEPRVDGTSNVLCVDLLITIILLVCLTTRERSRLFYMIGVKILQGIIHIFNLVG